MSSSMPIPRRKHPLPSSSSPSLSSSSSPSPTYSSPSSYSSTIFSSSSSSSSSSPPLSSKAAQKAPMNVHQTPTPRAGHHSRRPSLLSSSLSHSEYTVVNLGQSNGLPRLVTCVKSSQGFDWNQDLFLPSYADYDSLDLEHRPDPVKEIVLTDEEAKALLPEW